MVPKTKITLAKEQETLLIPLFAKAQNNPFFADEKAQQILEEVQYDFAQLKVPQKTAVTLRIRARQLDEYTSLFIAAHPEAIILHLGCGLDSRCVRVPHPAALWFDLDLPDVIELRRIFYAESESYHMLASSVTDPAWFGRIPADGRPVFVIAEGLLMYLHQAEVQSLVLRLHDEFPGCEMVFDAFSQYTADRIKNHPSIKKTGAAVFWGIDDPHEMEGWAKGIRLKEEWFFSQSADIQRLGWFYRMMFRLSSTIPAARRAQRLLYFML
jgi:O-methyltransferase involved in polyketide biosynthesis